MRVLTAEQIIDLSEDEQRPGNNFFSTNYVELAELIPFLDSCLNIDDSTHDTDDLIEFIENSKEYLREIE